MICTYLDLVAPKHELADNNPSDPASSSNNEHGGVLGLRDGELAHRATDEDGIQQALIGCGPGNLAKAGELAPDLIEYLARFTTKTDRIYVVKGQ